MIRTPSNPGQTLITVATPLRPPNAISGQGSIPREMLTFWRLGRAIWRGGSKGVSRIRCIAPASFTHTHTNTHPEMIGGSPRPTPDLRKRSFGKCVPEPELGYEKGNPSRSPKAQI